MARTSYLLMKLW